MGTFKVALEVSDHSRQRYVSIDALIDTGATYTNIPESVLDSLGVERKEVRRFRLADERVVQYSIGETLLRLEGREFTAPVVFAPDDTAPLVGMTTLEVFGLGVDPAEERLVQVDALGR